MVEPITLAVEGPTDVAVLERVIRDAGLSTGPRYVKNGKDALDRSLAGYNNAARFSPWLVLRDLNSDEECAPALRARLLPKPAPRMRFHVAVRALEAWLLADAEALSRFLAVSDMRVPPNPENVDRPKLEIVNLARRSRRRSVREALVPAPSSTARVGPGYAALITEFAAERWRPSVAANRSPSLHRLLRHLEALRENVG
jgi:hypothetical protein